MDLSAAPLEKFHVNVGEKLRMAYHSAGEGPTVVFLHGNPTSSYLWRNIIPAVSQHARCVAPDLIGHGDSDKLAEQGPGTYRFVEHREYLDDLLDQLELGDEIVLVLHDWGSGLGFDWANRHRDRVAGIAYMEAIVRPIHSWSEWPESARRAFQGFRDIDAGEEMIISKNMFVERVFPASVIRDMTEEEMAVYRAPFEDPLDRRPTLTWPREIPIEGLPSDVHEIVSDYSQWLSVTEIPKLFINADPGSILVGEQREFCRAWPNQTEVTVPGIHFIQEDSPHEIATAIIDWLPTKTDTEDSTTT